MRKMRKIFFTFYNEFHDKKVRKDRDPNVDSQDELFINVI